MASFTVPTLDTERLTLTGHRLDDFADSAAMWGDAEVTRHIGGRPSTEEEVWARLLRYAGHWAFMGFGYWVIREKATGRFVGEAGFGDFRRELSPGFEGAPEAGWALAPWAHGRGYATEAVRAILAWGETRFSGARTVCMIDPGNTASQRVAEKLGYREFVRTTYKGADTILFERPAR
jgi:RimJ/RimL family protein N-acetyltransferase